MGFAALSTGGHPTVPRWRRVLALFVGAVVAGAIAIADALSANRVSLLGAVGLAPIATAVLGAPAETALVAAMASAVALGSGFWDHTLSSWALYARLAIVTLIGAIAIIIAIDRHRRELIRQRSELLTRISRVANTLESLPETAARLAAAIVPQLADICILDLARTGTRRRLHVRANGPRAEHVESFLRERSVDHALGVDPAAADRGSGRPTLVERVGPEALRRWAQSASDRSALAALEINSLINVPLQARGESVGMLTLLVTAGSRRHYGGEDLDFATVLAGRAALALDIAGLSRRLTQLEQRLVGALGDVSDAITVQDRHGAPLYASDTALALLGLDSFEELHSAADGLPGLGLTVHAEDAEPVGPEQLPARRLLRGELDAPPVLLQRASALGGEERWLRVSSRAVHDGDGELVSVVSEFEDVTEAKRVELRSRMLTRASELLSASLDYETTVRRIAELAVERLADFCAVFLPNARGELRRVARAGAPGETGRRMAEALERWPDSPSGRESAIAVFNETRSQAMNDISDETLVARARDERDLALWRELGLTASMTVPLTAGGRCVGAIALIIARPGRRFGDGDLALAEELGRRAGQAIENARNYTTRSTIASTLQEALRPPELSPPEGWTLATWYVPAGEESTVGGDFYDVFPVSDGYFVLIGDVTGHGALAARLTGLARFTLRTAAELTQDPRTAIHRLDAALAAQPERAPVTCVCAHLADRHGGRVRARFAVAGHPLPMMVRNGRVTAVGRRGTLAGAAAAADWPESVVEFRTGDALVFYTDGVIETRNDGELFGRDRLVDCVRGDSQEPEAIIGRVRAELARFQTSDPTDDVTMLAMRFVGASEPGESAGQRRRRRSLLALARRRR